TALLRHTYFRPAWPEKTSPDLPQLSEALLRLLGEPRGREAYLASVERWAERQQEGLEDEQAEESRRRRTHELAKQCGAFLRRFFACWDAMPTTALPADHLAWLRHFVADLGLDRAGREEPAWQRFWEEVRRWTARDARRGSR